MFPERNQASTPAAAEDYLSMQSYATKRLKYTVIWEESQERAESKTHSLNSGRNVVWETGSRVN
jgi:hypothetical protein